MKLFNLFIYHNLFSYRYCLPEDIPLYSDLGVRRRGPSGGHASRPRGDHSFPGVGVGWRGGDGQEGLIFRFTFSSSVRSASPVAAVA